MTPEQKARVSIDTLLQQADWYVCSMADANIHASRGVALREFPLNTGYGFAKYLLYIDGKAAGVSRATHEGELLRLQVLAGDVLINIVDPPLGQVSVVPPTMAEANMNQAIARFRHIKPLSTKFMAHALMTEFIMAWAIRKAKTTAGQTNLTLDFCQHLPIPLPPLAEQERVVAEVDRRLSLVLGVQAEVNANLKHALWQAILIESFSNGS
ncbi:MAG: restriction endonuclease subunit S [Rhodoferax sp.]|nr:restriction endonuclease subunit S [Rhodoferax sp.]MDP3654057.1 restriction endonuclease subunit S [Rhodoferax sp.]